MSVSETASEPAETGELCLRPSEEATHAGGSEVEHSRCDERRTHRRKPILRLAQLLHGAGATSAERERSLGMDPLSLLLIALLPLVPVWLIWMALFLANDPAEEIRTAKHHQFLGPGGPDDPFADDPFDD